MELSLSKVTRKGQVTIPASIRKRLGIEIGTQVAFSVEADRVVLRPVPNDIRSLFGIVKARRSVSLREMDKTVSDMGNEDL